MTDADTPPDRSDDAVERDALAEDARTLVETVESIHPDPYVGAGGRVDLHASLERLVRDLPERATPEEFYRRAAPLVAGLGDSHSALLPPDEADSGGDDERLPLSFAVVGDRLYVEAVHEDSLADLLGSRLLALDGTPVGELVDRAASLYGAENEYGALSNAAELIRKPASLARLMNRSDPPTEPTVGLRMGGEELTVSPGTVTADADPTQELEPSFPHPAGTGPRYRLYDGGDTAVLVPGDLQGYRETLETVVERGADLADELVPAAYDRHVGGDRPDDVGEVLAALPSMIETLTEMADEMADAGTDTLIVDLRDNPGGDSQFVYHIAYVLQGWEAVARSVDGVRSLKRRTEPHRERYGTSEEGTGTASANPADYDFTEFFDDDGDDVERIRRLLEGSSDTFAAVSEEGTYEAAYDPDRVVVAVSAGTMSSAFAGAAQLSTLGADLVGVPSGQAPLSFGEAVREPLPNTGLQVRIACSMYHWVSDPDPDLLEVDRELTPELFETYDRAADAGLRLAFDHANGSDPGETKPEVYDE